MNKTFALVILPSLWWLLSVNHVTANPVPTQDIQPVMAITGAQAGPLSLPSDVAVDKQNVYVVDGGNHRVVVFTRLGKYRYTIGSKGESPGQFQGPVGIDVGTNGHIYVADTGNHRVQIFDTNGQFHHSFPVKDGSVKIRPIDVAVKQNQQEIYVTGNNNHKIMVFSADGVLIRAWGGQGLDPGQFRYPGMLSLVRDVRIAVVDILNTRVQLFESTGDFSIAIGEWGVQPGQLFRPKGVAVDHKMQLYISDSYLNLIQVFSETGKFQHVLRINGEQPGLETPTGMAIDEENRLYVAEMLNNKVSVFKLDR